MKGGDGKIFGRLVAGLRGRRMSGFSLGRRIIIIGIGLAICATSLILTSNMARELRLKEQNEVELWSRALGRIGPYGLQGDPLWQFIFNSNTSIPFLMVELEGEVRVVDSKLIPDKILDHPDLLRKEIDRLSLMNDPLVIRFFDGHTLYLFYGESKLLKTLRWFPLVQILVIVIFLVFSYMTFSSTKQDEQNRVWIGLAKETAHQLGTPTSSLLGWVEYLRSQPIDQMAVEEMSKDITRLMKVVDRFSKIGSETILSSANINEVVGDSVLYFRTRIPKNVTLDYNGLATSPVQAQINPALFEWVVENLLKNALDALQGKGTISVKISSDENKVYVDVSDNGKGIAKANHKRIFEPGFTTKTRGWGLGLSLSKRIIEEYHHGKIYVMESEPGKGTTIRIILKRSYE